MDPRMQDLLGRTNLDDLLKPQARELDFNQPVETSPLPKDEALRSTTDPLQVNFATADIAGKLQDSPTGRGVRLFALIFLGGPMFAYGLALVFSAWTNGEHRPLATLLATVFGLGMAGFWPYVIYAGRRRKATDR